MINIVAELRAERKRLQGQLQAIDKALKTMQRLSLSGISGAVRKARRSMSAAGRRRIVAAQKARWAKWQKKRKK